MSLLYVSNLSVRTKDDDGHAIVEDVSFELDRGQILSVVGESGAGKSVTGAAVARLLPPSMSVTSDRLVFDGHDLTSMPEARFRSFRGKRIGYIFQDPLTSLNPLLTVGQQLIDTIRTHERLSKKAALQRAVFWLRRVGIPSPEARLKSYPHEMSGGMRQRVVIALVLCSSPDLIIADEPTTALDVSIQAQIMELLYSVCREQNIACILVTHDMGLVAQYSDLIAVLYAGRIVEFGPTAAVLLAPSHPYTRGLLDCIPPLDRTVAKLHQIPGVMPKIGEWPTGCSFHPRCARSTDVCNVEDPGVTLMGQRRVHCHHAIKPAEVSE